MMRATSGGRTTSASENRMNSIPGTRSSFSAASFNPGRVPGGRSTWLKSPVMTHPAVFAQPGQEHLHLRRRRILRFIEDDERICKCPPAHEGERGHFEFAAGDPPDDLLARQGVVQRVEQRPEIGIDFLLHVAGQEPESFAGFDRGPRQDNAVDLARVEHFDRGAYGKVCLPSSRGTDREDHVAFMYRLDIAALRLRTGRNPLSMNLNYAADAGVVGAFMRQADGGIDDAFVHGVAVLDLFVQVAEGRAGDSRCLRRPGDRDMVAAACKRDVELLLDPGKMLVMGAVEEGQQTVVIELDMHRGGLGTA